MKKRNLIAFTILSGVALYFLVPSNKGYYYLQGERINFTYKSGIKAIYFNDVDYKNSLSKLYSQPKEYNKYNEYFGDKFLFVNEENFKNILEKISSNENKVNKYHYIIQDDIDKSFSMASMEIVAKFKDTLELKTAVEFFEKFDCTVVKQGTKIRPNRYIVKARNDKNVFNVSNALFESDKFKYAYPVFYNRIAQTSTEVSNPPTDEKFANQWYFADRNLDSGIDYLDAIEITKGNPEIKIAIVDDGFAVNHNDIVNKIHFKWDFINNNNDPTPEGCPMTSHGTKVAGIVGGAENGIGIVGGCPSCKLILLKAIESGGKETYIGDAFDMAIEQDASIISNSYHFNNTRNKDDIIDIIEIGITHYNTVFLFSMSNVVEDFCDSEYQYATIPNVIGVGGSTQNNTLAGYGYGPCLDVLAPGKNNMYTINCDNRYSSNFNGCSASTAIVAGVCGLLQSVNSNIPNYDIESILKYTSENLSDYVINDSVYGNKKINAFSALKTNVRLDVENYVVTAGEEMEINFVASSPRGLASINVYLDNDLIRSKNFAQRTFYIEDKLSFTIPNYLEFDQDLVVEILDNEFRNTNQCDYCAIKKQIPLTINKSS